MKSIKEQVKENAQELNRLQKEVDALEAQVRARNQETKILTDAMYAICDGPLRECRIKARVLEQALAREETPVRVSDHALVCYLERKLKLDMDVIRKEILTPELAEKMQNIGDGTYGKAVVKDKTVVTFLE